MYWTSGLDWWTGGLTLKTIFTLFNKTYSPEELHSDLEITLIEGNVTIGNVNTLKLIASDRTKTRLVCTLQAGSTLILHNVFNAKSISLDFVSCGVQGYLFLAVRFTTLNLSTVAFKIVGVQHYMHCPQPWF